MRGEECEVGCDVGKGLKTGGEECMVEWDREDEKRGRGKREDRGERSGGICGGGGGYMGKGGGDKSVRCEVRVMGRRGGEGKGMEGREYKVGKKQKFYNPPLLILCSFICT